MININVSSKGRDTLTWTIQDALEALMSRAIIAFCFCITILFAAPFACAAEDGSITVSTSYKTLLSNPEKKGMLDRLVKEAFRRIGLKAEIVFTPTGRSLADVNAGLLDAEINRIEGMEKAFPGLVRVPEPNMTMHFVAFSKRPYPVNGWKSIGNLHIGIVRGWKILEKNTENFPHVILVPTETELFNMLEKDRIDVALYDKLTGYEQLNMRGFRDIRHLDPPLESRDMFLYLNRRHADLAGKVAEALRDMKRDGSYYRIVEETVSHLRMD